MRRNDRTRRRSILRGSELPRLMTMIVMLGVLWMLIGRARDPSTWRWLVHEDPPSARVASGAAPAAPEAGKPAASAPAPDSAPAQAPAERPAAAEAEDEKEGTDLDPEQLEEIGREFPAINDKSIFMARQEMAAYFRIISWVLKQPEAALRKRARNDVYFTQLVQSPDKYRGQLLELQLDVRRILPCEKTERYDGPLYEVWGFTRESKAWLYVAVVPELPKGMPIGPEINESVRLVGYFFKLQGYHEANAKPHAPPLYAPLLIGRLVWLEGLPPQPASGEGYWIVILAGAFLLVTMISVGFAMLGRRRRRSALARSGGPKPGALTIDEWFQHAEAGDAPLEQLSDQRGSDDADENPSDGNNLGKTRDIMDGEARPGDRVAGNGKLLPHSSDGSLPQAE